QDSNGYTLTVNGDVVNNGTISDNSYLYLNISGNILNNGTWNNSRTTLTFPSSKFRMTNTPTWEEPKNTSSYEITDYLTTQHHWQISADGNTWSEQRGINDPSLVATVAEVITPPVQDSNGTISGFIRTPEGQGIANISLCLVSYGEEISHCDGNIRTDANGYFTFNETLPNNNYNIEPNYTYESGQLAFKPEFQEITIANNTIENIDFTATLITTDDDHGDTPFASTPIPLNGNISGQMNTDFDRDCFKIDVPSYGLLTVNITSNANIYALLAKITNRGGERLITEEGKNFNISQELEADSYYLCLDGQQNYSFNTAFIPLQASSCNSDNCTASYSVSNEAANIPCIVAPGLGTFEAELTMIPNSNPPRLALSGIKQVSQDCAGRPSLYLPDIGKLNIPELNIPELGDIFDVTLGLFKQSERPEFTIESVKPSLKQILSSLPNNKLVFTADVYGETHVVILERVDNPSDPDGIYWRKESSNRTGSPKNITVIFQENIDLAFNGIKGYDYPFTLEHDYNNPNDKTERRWRYVTCDDILIPSYHGFPDFFKIENPSCRQKAYAERFLTIVDHILRIAEDHHNSLMLAMGESNEEGQAKMKHAMEMVGGFKSLQALGSGEVKKIAIAIVGEVGSEISKQTGIIISEQFGGEWGKEVWKWFNTAASDTIFKNLDSSKLGKLNIASTTEFAVEKMFEIGMNAIFTAGIEEELERVNEIRILREYLKLYFGYGANQRMLAKSLGFSPDIHTKKIVQTIAKNAGLSDWVFAEDYEYEIILNSINKYWKVVTRLSQ
ncbi:MAG: carboxypeptidase-like regulatory domain-containing protein, partial [Candidatus Marithrix sp.]